MENRTTSLQTAAYPAAQDPEPAGQNPEPKQAAWLASIPMASKHGHVQCPAESEGSLPICSGGRVWTDPASSSGVLLLSTCFPLG